MNDAAYLKRLRNDLPRWRAAGWVTETAENAILADVGSHRRSAFGMAPLLGLLGAVLLGIGVIAFVGANWDEISRGVRLVLIFSGLALAYGIAFALERAGLRAFAEAATLAAGLFFAASIALIGQTFHLSGDFEGAILLFVVGVLGAALMTGSITLTVLGVVGTGYWTWVGTVDAGTAPHLPSLLAMIVGLIIASAYRSHYGRAFSILAILYWVFVSVIAFSEQQGMSFAAGAALLVSATLVAWAVGFALRTFAAGSVAGGLGTAIVGPALVAILLALGIMQLAEHPVEMADAVSVPALIGCALAVSMVIYAVLRGVLTVVDLTAVVMLSIGAMAFLHCMPEGEMLRILAGGIILISASVWAVFLGHTGRQNGAKFLGLAAFGVEVAYLYGVTIGTLLDTALAFLGGGALFILIAFLMYWIDRTLSARPGADMGRTA